MSKRQIWIMIGIFATTFVLLTITAVILVVAFSRTESKEQQKSKAEGEARLEQQLSRREKVIYAVTDIGQGVVIKKNDLTVRLIAAEKVPEDAVKTFKRAVGHKAKYGIQKGYIVSINDLDP